MNMDELLKHLHNYSKVENYLRQHPEIAESAKKFDFYIKQVNPDDAKKLLFPLVEDLHRDEVKFFPEGYFFKDKEAMEIKMSRHTRFTPPIRHKHDFYELFYVYEGEFKQYINDITYTMESGDVCIIPPGVYHAMNVQNHSIVINILIKRSAFRNIFFNDLQGDSIITSFYTNSIMEKNPNNFIIFKTYGDREIANLILRMYLEVINQNTFYQQMLHSYLLQLLARLLRYYSSDALTNSVKEAYLENYKIIRFMENNLTDVSLNMLSKRFNYSKQTISMKIFKVSGKNYLDLLTDLRMQRAEKLLKETNLKIYDISEECGLSSVEYFIRLFKKKFHQTPTNYRKKQKSK